MLMDFCPRAIVNGLVDVSCDKYSDKIPGTEKPPNLSALTDNQGQIHPTLRHINRTTLIFFAQAVARARGCVWSVRATCGNANFSSYSN